MANRVWAKLLGSLTPGLVTLTGVVKLGAAGAISSQACNGFSVAHGGTGLYNITLEDSYNRLDSVTVTLVDTAPVVGKATFFYPTVASANAVDAGSSKVIAVQGFTVAMAAAVPNDTTQLRIVIVLKNSGRTA